jgi:hypothetical protein
MKTRLLFGLLACAVFVPIASANSYDFTACPTSNPGCTVNAALPSTVTYTNNGISITANGYSGLPGPLSSQNLFFKNAGTSETGLGIVESPNDEIGPGLVIQLDLTNLAKAGVTSGTLTIGSVQVDESFQICNSVALGVIGTCSSPVAGNAGAVFPEAVIWSVADPIISVIAGPNTANTNDDVLLVGQFTTPTPTPFTGCTVTQGGWHATPHGNNPGTLLANDFPTLYPSGVTIGGTFTLTFDSAADVRVFLPAGGTPGVLTFSATDPTTSAAGVFAGQVLALQLNVDIEHYGTVVISGTGTSFDGKTVADVLAAANTALGGGSLPAGFTISSLNDLVDSLNQRFDNCR